jgi:hypothetical protein
MGRLSQQEIEEALYEEDQISIELARVEGDGNPDGEDPYRDEPLDSSKESSQDDSEYYFSKKYDLDEDPYADMGYSDDWYDDHYYEEVNDSALNALVLAFAF